jgi:catechol 2,3-dioxygenase-like lactoylglutathione lyase family enzyme
MLKRILHTGVAVPDLEAAIKFYELLGFQEVKRFHKPEPDMDVVMVQRGEIVFELFVFNDLEHPHIPIIRNHVAIYSE